MLFLDLLLFICIIMCIICCFFLFKKVHNLQNYELEFSKMLEIANVSSINERELSQKAISEIKNLLKEALDIKNHMDKYLNLNNFSSNNKKKENTIRGLEEDNMIDDTIEDDIVEDNTIEDTRNLIKNNHQDNEYKLILKKNSSKSLKEFNLINFSDNTNIEPLHNIEDTNQLSKDLNEDYIASYDDKIIKKMDFYSIFKKVSKN